MRLRRSCLAVPGSSPKMLAKAAVLAATSVEFLAWSGLGASDTIEARVEAATAGRAAWAAGAAGARPAEDPVNPA